MRFSSSVAAAVAFAAMIPAATVTAAETTMDEAARMQYALGYQLGRDLTGVAPRPQDMLRGLEDGRSGAKARLSDAEMDTALAALEQRVKEQRGKAQAATAEKARVAGTDFLAKNAKKPGVQTTSSGLQYRVVTPGTGRSPTAADTVTVHYKGTLVDGTEFDSSHKRGQPATLPVGGVIPGWTEALQLMKVGSKLELAIPPSLAYGDQGPLAGQVLLFDVELLSVASATETQGKP